MRMLLTVCLARTRLQLLENLQYPLSMAIWQVGVVLQPVISIVVWTTVAAAGDGQIAGYAAADFVAYFLVLMVVNSAIFTSAMYEIEWRIRRGELSALLLQPSHPVSRDIAFSVGAGLHALLMIVPAAIVLAILFRPALHPVPWAIAAAVPAVALAACIRFLVEYTLGLAAFWLTRMGAINALYYPALLFFSGQMAPLALFPPAVQQAAALLPFRWMLAFPVELLLGRLTPAETVRGLASQIVWLTISLAGMTLVWRRGVRHYAAVGA